MGELKHIAFEEESEEIKGRVSSYWTKRAQSFFEQRIEELKTDRAKLWLEEIKSALQDKENAKILDVGCGAGFFEVLLGKEGYEVTGIDLTEDMVAGANELIRLNGLDQKKVHAYVMDAENPDFPDETFDAVITRNLTWTLPHPIDAYKQWHRVLKNCGVLLNFDAEYAKGAHNLNAPENKAHRKISADLKEECHEIYHMLTVSNLDRPAWDKEVLLNTGFRIVDTDEYFYKRMYKEEDDFYIPDHMFKISAFK